MSEQEPKQEFEPIKIKLGGNEVEMTERNTILFTFLGRVAIRDEEYDASRFNHVFIRPDENENAGIPIFKEHGVFEALAQQCIARDFPLIMNMRRVPPGDIKAYFDTLDKIAEEHAKDIPDEIPEDWQ